MKLLFLLCVIGVIGITVYHYSSGRFSSKKKQIKNNLRPLSITAGIVLLLLSFVTYGMYKSATAPDTQCTIAHTVESKPPINLKTAQDYFAQGNYDYDSGNCAKAITDYTNAVSLYPYFAQAYNNRAYTYMRMQNYKAALSDLDKAIQLKPHYIQALMNRGDIHNYYYQIDRQSAVTDYEKVISYGGTQATNVCGHLFLARHKGWNFGTILDLPSNMFGTCK